MRQIGKFSSTCKFAIIIRYRIKRFNDENDLQEIYKNTRILKRLFSFNLFEKNDS